MSNDWWKNAEWIPELVTETSGPTSRLLYMHILKYTLMISLQKSCQTFN